MTVSIMAFSLKTPSIVTLRIMMLSVTPSNIMGIIWTLSIKDSQHNGTHFKYRVSF
jgi:hypothetical protein